MIKNTIHQKTELLKQNYIQNFHLNKSIMQKKLQKNHSMLKSGSNRSRQLKTIAITIHVNHSIETELFAHENYPLSIPDFIISNLESVIENSLTNTDTIFDNLNADTKKYRHTYSISQVIFCVLTYTLKANLWTLDIYQMYHTYEFRSKVPFNICIILTFLIDFDMFSPRFQSWFMFDYPGKKKYIVRGRNIIFTSKSKVMKNFLLIIFSLYILQ